MLIDSKFASVFVTLLSCHKPPSKTVVYTHIKSH